MPLKILPFVFIILLSVACSEGNGETDQTPSDTVNVAPSPAKEFKRADTEFKSPESITTDGQFFYVSNLGEEMAPSKVDGDGFILRIQPDGHIVGKVAEGVGLNAPKGMVVIDGILYVTDIDRIVAIDPLAQTFLWESFCPDKTSFLNDLAVANGGMYVSATDISKIYFFNPKAKTWSPVPLTDVNSPNGLAYDEESNVLYCAEYPSTPTGRLLRINLETGKAQAVREVQGQLDGIALTGDGRLVFSNWSDYSIHLFDLEVVRIDKIPFQDMGGPADLYYDESSNVIWVPRMIENQLAKIELMQRERVTAPSR